ncbi:HlyD family type I secretion periplasmic adaptor subunit [Methylobacterium sp. WL30]|uniref:HlyD family type I secretion periplasmic adaptor subunit n=1 Tax=unclassified Methylobacterium TaxID=2615210 RepID=UPI0011CCC978|nr:MULTISPECIES: HlyD family type I secretion periplasmic adaptor subunit [unclassified Methylobacterium]TXM89750.1 HlyD family type I secretion periplasmic adaptor subunit [Methylobacterium sp. WL116]TXN40821.1 HlyD family type I secretion periplasmic adaptor subunit [Methylobacterium sp. WL93]TXN50723.1 HlyD family type I secretion periplasmic adaptor subunit [Methylobacterium sp. WL119]TXN62964.1 HlyD family type I secretion periplasmic adaptor subunit [Methylobacterium sp. WL30]
MGQVHPFPIPEAGRATARAFLPAHLELLETPASPTLRATGWVLMALVAGAVGWACFSEIEIVATAQGRVVPVGEVKLVQPLETSVVRGIHVLEGQHVVEGEVLVDLDPTEASADLEATRMERMQALLDAEAARLLLSETPEPVIAPLAEVEPALLAATQEQVRLQMREHRAALAELGSEIADKNAALAAKAFETARNTELTPLAEDRYATQKGLYDRGNASKLNLLQAQYDLIDKQTEKRSLPEQTHQLRAEIAGLEQKRTQVHAQFLKEAADQRVKALQKVAVADQSLRKERQREALRHLRASVSGVVQDLKVHTLGGVANAAESLMTIVPDAARLEVETFLPHREMGFVREGQRAETKLEAFPFTRYGTVPGAVRLVSREASVAPKPPGQAPAPTASGDGEGQGYRLLVSLDRAQVRAEGAEVALRPGMTAQVDIATGKRRIVAFLLDPIEKHVSEAGHER